MHMAAVGGHLEVIKYLAPRFGNRVQEEDDDSLTALLLVAEMGHFEVARWLIDDLKMDPQDKDKVCVGGWHGKKGKSLPCKICMASVFVACM